MARTGREVRRPGRYARSRRPVGIVGNSRDCPYAYDDLGRKVAAWTGAGDTLNDARTQATTLTEYTYDELDRLVKTTAVRRFGVNVDLDPSPTAEQVDETRTFFAADGMIDFELLPTAGGDVTKDLVYDSQGRVESIHHFVDADADHAFDTGETLLSGFVYTYYDDGSRASEVWTNEDGLVTTRSWTYDNLNRLIEETYDGVDGAGDPLAYTDSFAFDLSGNRVELVHDDRTSGTTGSAGADAVTTSTYDANDRLLTETKDSVDDRHTVYEYGGPTNPGTEQTKKIVHQGLTSSGTIEQTTTFTYDAMGRMTGVSINDGTTTTSVTYAYDHNGFRVERTENNVTTVYHVDPSNHTGYAQVIEEGIDADSDHELDAGEVEKAFTLALDVLTQALANEVLHLLYDAHGSTRAVLDAAVAPAPAAILQSYAYSAYGADLGLANALTAVRYAGEMIDPFSGLSFNRARWYDHLTGRFGQIDPWAGDTGYPLTLNDYAYTHANPLMGVDPSGAFFTVLEQATVSGIQLVRPIGSLLVAGAAKRAAVSALANFAIQGLFRLASGGDFFDPVQGLKDLGVGFAAGLVGAQFTKLFQPLAKAVQAGGGLALHVMLNVGRGGAIGLVSQVIEIYGDHLAGKKITKQEFFVRVGFGFALGAAFDGLGDAAAAFGKRYAPYAPYFQKMEASGRADLQGLAEKIQKYSDAKDYESFAKLQRLLAREADALQRSSAGVAGSLVTTIAQSLDELGVLTVVDEAADNLLTMFATGN